LKGTLHNSVAAALKDAQEQATAEDMIFVGGSCFTVAEAL
jgi:folylpolyglutamate synthase/dihydropteroate synthase